MTTMDKTFDPAEYEGRLQRWWSEEGFFVAEAPSERPSYCIMIPPPNVTGSLHIGHALQSALQDVLTRWRRMGGFNALWLPGTDHAGIATQLMVERQVEAEGSSREELGREAFLERVWAWKENYHGNIRRQLDQLGASCDWSRERFTLDEGLSRAVREAFVRLYEEGLIYRGEYIVNWSPGLDTAISDLEVEMKEVQGKLYHVAYPVEGGEERIVVATTRPETMLGDTAVAYHPEDERYAHLAGRNAVLPIVGRAIPFVADEAVDREFGTGLVKVTPFHDPNDFEIGRRHDLPGISVIDRRARMTEAAGEDFAGLDRFEARQRVVDRLRAEGWLLEVEDHVHNVGHCQRSGTIVEPLVSTQWFCRVDGMAARALGEVEGESLELVPDTWRKTWEHWLSEIRPWCVSRQLWWGHRIPAWYAEDGTVHVARTREEAEEAAGTDRLEQDPDVLDTWFSSALWPFSTLGWPDETDDLETFYPTNVLITGHDILFFWVARMVMTGVHFTGRLPFRTVHLTGLVRDAEGRKMSKTRGNTVDPLELVERYGADALRFTLVALDSPGRDIPLDEDRLAGYRSFGNKIWNATRFVLSRAAESRVSDDLDPAALDLPERWILSRLERTEREVNVRLETFRFDEACRALHSFFWGELCDWAIELAKPSLFGDAVRPRTGDVLLTVLERSLRLLHPVMPFLTEELWQKLPGHESVHPTTITLAPYPTGDRGWTDEQAESEIGTIQELIGWVRTQRAESGIGPAAEVGLHLAATDDGAARLLSEQEPLVRALARAAAVEPGPIPENALSDRLRCGEVGLTFEGRDLGSERRSRMVSELEEVNGQIARLESLLSNEQFVAKAPERVVAENSAKAEELRQRRAVLQRGLE